MFVALIIGCFVALVVASSASETRTTSAIIASLTDSSYGHEPLELVQLQETVTIEAATLHQHLYINVNPVWGDLAAGDGASIEWTACGGQFRSHWELEFDVDEYPQANELFRDAKQHTRCGVASAVVCGDSGQSQQLHFQSYVGRVMSKLSVATSSELEWRDSTPQHQRPIGVAVLNTSRRAHQCQALLAPESTLCTQHMVTILSRNSGDHILDDVSMTYPEVLSSPWHQLTLRIHRNATHVMIVKRLRLVASHKLVPWVREYVPPNVGSSVTTRRQTPPSSPPLDWGVRWSVQNTYNGEGVIDIVITPPHTNTSLQGKVSGDLAVQALLMFPTTQLRPLLHTLAHNTHFTVRRLLHDHELATLTVIVEVAPAAFHRELDGSTHAVLRLPFVPVFGPLSQRPPDANKRYLLPQPMLQVVSDACTSPNSDQQQQSGWTHLFLQKPHRCYSWYRSPAEHLVHVSLAVPDSAMVFNAVSIALLPFSVLLGTILRRTGRDV
ncbi:membrane-associated protein, putative [Bodo saltans]|uniref:Membrane-associated protein, putative n=1 Tax=Bodo saltans TaxID=75058 RepID=A0A0S4JTZ4_BODSA|nr:membrane-associated protein, putative [Bodo saltans]|eukprot:CUG93755.1 membrane-associated protein, putative [Bodo saltans]